MAVTATVAVLFCDLVSSTERQTRLGDDAADRFRRRFFAALRAPVTSNGGTEIKTLGDGLMATFESTTGALLCAIDMHHAMTELDAEDPVLLRIGISVGEVGHEDDDWFGTPVVEAARLQAAATPGGTYATSLVRTVVGSRGAKLRFTELGPMLLKGLPVPIDVVAVTCEGDPPVAVPPPRTPSPSRTVSEEVATPRKRSTRLSTLGAAVLFMLIVAGSAWLIAAAGNDDEPTDGGARGNGSITEPSGYRPSFRKVTCSAEDRNELPEAECGRLIVPEVRAKPLGRKIAVDVVRAPALGEATSPPVILADDNEVLATSPLREHADVYEVRLRGLSPFDQPRLECPELREAWRPTLAAAPDDPGAIATQSEAARACARRLRSEGVQLEGYNLAEVADDFRDLVIALDLDRVSVAAGGVTTPAAALFARANPGAVESLLLANPTPPGETPLGDPTLNLSRSLEALVALCHNDERCRDRDLAGEFAARVDAFDADPQTVLTTPLSDGEAGVGVLLDGRRMGAALATALKSSDQLPLVPSAISPNGVSPQLLAAASVNDELRFYAGDDAVAGAVLSYLCSYDVHPNRTAEVTEAALPHFRGANSPSLQPLCEAWDVPLAFDRLDEPLTGDLPVLFAEGGLSAAGANGWSAQMATDLPNSKVVHLPTLSDDVAFRQPACLRAIRRAFLDRPRAAIDVSACEADSPPIEFVGL